MEKIKKIFESIKLKWLRETSLTILLIAIIVAVFIGINIGLSKLNITDVDLTEEKLYSLTDTSKEQIAKIPENEWLIGYLLSFGTEVEIIKPTYLKNMIAEYAKKIYEKNKS